MTALAQRSAAVALALARAEAKALISRIAMQIGETWRAGLLAQLDSLLDPDEWDDRDTPLKRTSFEAFLTSMLYMRPNCRPGLSLSSEGNIVASWTDGSNHLSVEYLANRRTRWLVSSKSGEDTDRNAGVTSSEQLILSLAPYLVSQRTVSASTGG